MSRDSLLCRDNILFRRFLRPSFLTLPTNTSKAAIEHSLKRTEYSYLYYKTLTVLFHFVNENS